MSIALLIGGLIAVGAALGAASREERERQINELSKKIERLDYKLKNKARQFDAERDVLKSAINRSGLVNAHSNTPTKYTHLESLYSRVELKSLGLYRICSMTDERYAGLFEKLKLQDEFKLEDSGQFYASADEQSTVSKPQIGCEALLDPKVSQWLKTYDDLTVKAHPAENVFSLTSQGSDTVSCYLKNESMLSDILRMRKQVLQAQSFVNSHEFQQRSKPSKLGMFFKNHFAKNSL